MSTAVQNDKKAAGAPLAGAEKTEKGLCFNGFIMEPIVEKCEGCDRVVTVDDERYCPSYAQPARKWARGLCNFATHVKGEVKGGKVKINPLKASKRAARSK